MRVITRGGFGQGGADRWRGFLVRVPTALLSSRGSTGFNLLLHPITHVSQPHMLQSHMLQSPHIHMLQLVSPPRPQGSYRFVAEPAGEFRMQPRASRARIPKETHDWPEASPPLTINCSSTSYGSAVQRCHRCDHHLGQSVECFVSSVSCVESRVSGLPTGQVFKLPKFLKL